MSFPLFDICERKHGGNAESVAAFAQIADTLPEQRRRVYELILSKGEYGATAQECADAFGVGINCVSGRLSELKRDGLIARVGTRNGGGVCVAIEYAAKEAA